MRDSWFFASRAGIDLPEGRVIAGQFSPFRVAPWNRVYPLLVGADRLTVASVPALRAPQCAHRCPRSPLRSHGAALPVRPARLERQRPAPVVMPARLSRAASSVLIRPLELGDVGVLGRIPLRQVIQPGAGDPEALLDGRRGSRRRDILCGG